jgi:flagellar biosynthesis protein FliR
MEMKIILGVILTISVTNAFWLEQTEIQFHLWNIVLLALKEFMVGIALGLATNSIFYAARFAGGVIDFEMGYQTSLLFSKDQTAPTLVGEFYELITVMIFLIINGHHFLIESLYASVRAVPIGTFEVTESTVQLLIRYMTTVFIIGIKMAAPVLIALFLTNLSLALLARIAPQTNIFILSFQLKVAVGLLVLFASVSLFVMVAKYSLQTMETEALRIILSLNPIRV